MNIQMMVQNRRLTQQVRAAAQKPQPDAFQQKLLAFREQNHFDRLQLHTQEEPEEPDKADKTDKTDLKAVLCSMQLYDGWDEDLTAQQVLDKLNTNLEKIGEAALASRLKPQEVMEHLAAQRTVYRRLLLAKGSGEQAEAADKIVELHTRLYAEGLSKSVGGFYEKQGIQGTLEKLYQSVVAGVQALAGAYERFANSDVIDMDALAGDAHTNSLSLSNELRKAFVQHGEAVQQTGGSGRYSLQEIGDLHRLARFSYFFGQTGTIKVRGEEELGVHLGTAYVEAIALSSATALDKQHQLAFLKKISQQMDGYLDRVDELLADPPQGKTAGALNRDAVQDVINWMYSAYDTTKSVQKAIRAGKEFGVAAYLSRAAAPDAGAQNHASEKWKETVQEMLKRAKPGSRLYRAGFQYQRRV